MLLRLAVDRPAAVPSVMLPLPPIFFALAAPVMAASPSPVPQTSPAPARSEYVEVTAKGLHEEAETIPAMVTVIGGDEARARNADDLRAALAGVAGAGGAPRGGTRPPPAGPALGGPEGLGTFLPLGGAAPW